MGENSMKIVFGYLFKSLDAQLPLDLYSIQTIQAFYCLASTNSFKLLWPFNYKKMKFHFSEYNLMNLISKYKKVYSRGTIVLGVKNCIQQFQKNIKIITYTQKLFITIIWICLKSRNEYILIFLIAIMI